MPKKRKILYIITKSSLGGAGRYVFDLATNLTDDKFETIVAMGGGGALKTLLDKKNVRTIEIPRLSRDVSLLDDILALFSLIKLFKREEPDVVHLNSSKIGGLGALAGRIYNFIVWAESFFLKTKNLKLKTKIIFTAHGWAFKEERPFWQKLSIRLFSWLTVILSHYVIAVSEDDLRKTPGLFVSKQKISKIHNGVTDFELYEKRKARLTTAKLGNTKFGAEAFLVGTIAEFHKNKGLSFLIEAFARIEKLKKNSFLVLISDGEERKNLEKKASLLNIRDRVIFTGMVEDANRLLAAFDIFILPSIKEGLPYTILEAGIARLPVVATSVGGIPEIIEDMRTGILVRPRAPEEIARAIRFLIDNPDRASEFGKNLHEKVSRDFSLEKMLGNTTTLYN